MNPALIKAKFDTVAQSTAVASDCYTEGKYDDSLAMLDEAAEEIGDLIQHLESLTS